MWNMHGLKIVDDIAVTASQRLLLVQNYLAWDLGAATWKAKRPNLGTNLQAVVLTAQTSITHLPCLKK